MKAMKTLLASLLCFCMVVCFSMTAFAAAPTGSITIKNPSQSDATVGGKTFNVYKLFNATTSGSNTSYSWYVDQNGEATYDVQYNPNGSSLAIEGITSPDGRVLGKMGHSERVGDGLYRNVIGDYDIKMFKSMVKYFK